MDMRGDVEMARGLQEKEDIGRRRAMGESDEVVARMLQRRENIDGRRGI